MLTINNRKYFLLLLDTNALSNFIKSPEHWITWIKNKFLFSQTIICYSIFSLSELQVKDYLFEKYLDLFSLYPSAILDGYETLVDKEIKAYKSELNPVNPILLLPYAIKSERNIPNREKLEMVLADSQFYNNSKYWIDSRKDILIKILRLIENYPPKNRNYTVEEIDDFVEKVSIQQLILKNGMVINKIINIEEQCVNHFKSIKAISYLVFYKFYTDNKKPSLSDIHDLLISSLPFSPSRMWLDFPNFAGQ